MVLSTRAATDGSRGDATTRGGVPTDRAITVERFRDELGDFPLVGFFANGEISNNRLYGYTGVLTLFL